MQTCWHRIFSPLVAGLLLSSRGWAADWPQFLGPQRNGIYDGADLAEEWPTKGPQVLWQKSVGHGFSGPVVANGKLILFTRAADQETVTCFNAASGDAVWTFAYPTTYDDDFGFDNGPRATPAISEGRVYTLGAQGLLHCLDLPTGKKLWSADLQTQFQAGKGFFGIACSPLLEGVAVLLNIGGAKGAGIVALRKTDGKLLWKTSNDEASYSSPVCASINGSRYALFLTREGLVGVDPATGQNAFDYSWHSRNRMSVNAATPLVIGNEIFVSASYGTGAVLLRLNGRNLEKVWAGDDRLSNHYATSVALKGFLYGIHGRTDPGFSPPPQLRCVELKTGKVAWQNDSIGAASLILAGGRLLILTAKGELVLANANPESFQPQARARIFQDEVRAFPALAEGLFYARSKDQLVCLDLRRERPR
jgi:outer membrane protein assembly factor BamB